VRMLHLATGRVTTLVKTSMLHLATVRVSTLVKTSMLHLATGRVTTLAETSDAPSAVSDAPSAVSGAPSRAAGSHRRTSESPASESPASPTPLSAGGTGAGHEVAASDKVYVALLPGQSGQLGQGTFRLWSIDATTGPVTSVPLPDLQCELLGGDPASATNRNAVDSTSMTKPAVEPISGPISAIWSPPDVAAVLASSVALLLLLLLACGYRRHRRLASASFHLRVSRDRAQFDLQLLEHRFKKRRPQFVTILVEDAPGLRGPHEPGQLVRPINEPGQLVRPINEPGQLVRPRSPSSWGRPEQGDAALHCS